MLFANGNLICLYAMPHGRYGNAKENDFAEKSLAFGSEIWGLKISSRPRREKYVDRSTCLRLNSLIEMVGAPCTFFFS